MPKTFPLPENPRILIVRLSAIGDVIHAMPMALALRERFPSAYLAWASSYPAAALLEGHEALDEVIVLGRRWLRSPREILAVRKRLRAQPFDVAIDAQGLTKSAMVARLSGAPLRIGFGDHWGREISRWLHTELVRTKTKHTVDRTLELVEPLGIVRPQVRFQVPVTDAERKAAERILVDLEVPEPLAILNAGAGWPSKLWPPDRFGAVARHLGSQWRLPSIVVWAGREERARAETIVANADGHARLAPPTSLRELAALCQRARLFVSSDRCARHRLAAPGGVARRCATAPRHPCRGCGHALRGALWPVAGRGKRALRPRSRRRPENDDLRPQLPAATCVPRPHGSNRCALGVRGVRPDPPTQRGVTRFLRRHASHGKRAMLPFDETTRFPGDKPRETIERQRTTPFISRIAIGHLERAMRGFPVGPSRTGCTKRRSGGGEAANPRIAEQDRPRKRSRGTRPPLLAKESP